MTDWMNSIEGIYENSEELLEALGEFHRDNFQRISPEFGPRDLLDQLQQKGQIHLLSDGQYEVRLVNSQRKNFGESAQYFALLEGEEGHYSVEHIGIGIGAVADYSAGIKARMPEPFLVGLFPVSSEEQLEERVNGLLGRNPQKVITKPYKS